MQVMAKLRIVKVRIRLSILHARTILGILIRPDAESPAFLDNIARCATARAELCVLEVDQAQRSEFSARLVESLTAAGCCSKKHAGKIAKKEWAKLLDEQRAGYSKMMFESALRYLNAADDRDSYRGDIKNIGPVIPVRQLRGIASRGASRTAGSSPRRTERAAAASGGGSSGDRPPRSEPPRGGTPCS